MDSNIPPLFDEVVVMDNPRGKGDRFEYAKVRKGNTWYFYKNARTEAMIPNIQREIVWSEFMNRIEAFYPTARLFGPDIERRVGTTGIVLDYIDAPLVAEPGELDAWQRVIPRYAEMLVLFDTIALNWKSENLPDEPSRSDHVYPIWQEWLGESIDRYERLDEAHKRLESVHFKLTKCLQHGDLTPWQIFDLKGNWIVYDGEKCGTDLFRFTDLAYGYGRLYTTLGSRVTAQQLLREFMEHHAMEREQFMKEFLPVLIHRAVGCLADAYNDAPEHDYIELAEELLDAALDKNIAAITGN